MDTHAALLRRADALGLHLGAVRNPWARRVRRGVYCLDGLRKPTFEESVVAALLTLPPGSVAAGFTAARLWRLDGLPAADPPLEFLVRGRSGNLRPSGSVLRYDRFTGVDLPDGIPATSLPRTVVDLVTRSSFGDGLVLVEAALRDDPSVATDLVRELARRTPRRGSTTVRRVLAAADVLSESVLESRARVLWLDAALPPPTQQAVIRRDGKFVARVDFLWEDARLIVEVDGMAKYDDRDALRDEKRRQNELVALGYTVLRFTWSDILGRSAHVVAQVERFMINTAKLH